MIGRLKIFYRLVVGCGCMLVLFTLLLFASLFPGLDCMYLDLLEGLCGRYALFAHIDRLESTFTQGCSERFFATYYRESIPVLIDQLAAKSNRRKTRASQAIAFVAIKTNGNSDAKEVLLTARASLAKLFTDQDRDVRLEAARAYVEVTDDASATVIVFEDLLRDADSFFRAWVLSRIGCLGWKGSALVPSLERSSEPGRELDRAEVIRTIRLLKRHPNVLNLKFVE